MKAIPSLRFSGGLVLWLWTGMCLAALAACSSPAGGGRTAAQADEQQLYIGDSIAVARTQYGQVRGYILRDIYTFRGIPYGASTAGSNRFMPPREPEPWEGIRPAVFWGASAPQLTEGKYRNDYNTFSDHWNYYDVGEDCLMLNVWTPALADGKKRPVLVWLHGGGFTNGNAYEQDGYNGENLSRYGDIVFVSLNHRLGPIGFSDFSAVDKKFAESGNVGILDVVAGLKWVHNNIEAFGGDPANVTIMGQSGGGAKVCTLVAMAETKGLVHKGVALSGNITGAIDSRYSAGLGRYILKEAGLKPGQMAKLQQMPWHDYIELANRAAEKYNREKGGSGMMRGAFGPVGDGFHVPMDVFYADTHAPSNNVPMLFCTTNCEFSLSRTDAALEQMTREQLLEWVGRMKGADKAKALVDAYDRAFPGKKPIELLGLILSARDKVIAAANAKARQDAPVYLAWFGWNPPLFDGRMRAFHCLDISFWLKNTDVMLTHTGGGSRPRALSDKMADALLSFMRTGNPNCDALPHWPEYTPEEGATMLLNDTCSVAYDPDREARKAL